MRAHVLVSMAAVIFATSAFSQTDAWWNAMQRGIETEQAGDYARAAAFYRQAVEIADKLGPQDVRRAYAWNAVAKTEDVLGNYAGAEATYRRALKAAEQARGKGTAYALVLENIATLYAESGQYARAEPIAREALAIMTGINPPDDVGLAMSESCLSTILDLTGRHQMALEMANASLPVFENHPEAWPQTVATLNTMASARYTLGEYPASEELLLRAQATLERYGGTDHPMLARILTNLGMVELRAGRRPEAEEKMRRAMTIAETRLGLEHPGYGLVLAAYATYLRQVGEKGRARAMEAKAGQILRDSRRRNGTDSVVDFTALQRKK